MSQFSIRKADAKDIEELISLFKQTVLEINRRDYSEQEVQDWASCGDNIPRWEHLMATLHFIVAVNKAEKIIGFSSLSKEGHLHSMFVHRDFQSQGVASRLLQQIESYAKTQNTETITSEVSITARPFFEKHGYRVIAEQQRKANLLYLTNYRMEKHTRQ